MAQVVKRPPSHYFDGGYIVYAGYVRRVRVFPNSDTRYISVNGVMRALDFHTSYLEAEASETCINCGHYAPEGRCAWCGYEREVDNDL